MLQEFMLLITIIIFSDDEKRIASWCKSKITTSEKKNLSSQKFPKAEPEKANRNNEKLEEWDRGVARKVKNSINSNDQEYWGR